MMATQDHLWLVCAIVGAVAIGEALDFLAAFVGWMDRR